MIRWLLFEVLAASLLISCVDPEVDDLSFPFRAEILASDSGFYQLQVVQFETLLDVASVSGSLGRVEAGATLDISSDIDEIIKSTNPNAIYSDRGAGLKIDYYTDNGVIIPENFSSMEVLGLYYSYEKTVRFWQENFNLDLAVSGFPSLYYNPKLQDRSQGSSTEVTLALNAAYLSGVKDFWFFKTSPQEKVPVKMNFGVIAHEFGHYIFDLYFADFDPRAYDTTTYTNEYFLSALNEGLADYFSFMVTGSVAEFGASLDELEEQRRLPVAWTSATLNDSNCTGGFYCNGSLLASALYEISATASFTSLSLGTMVLETLSDFRSYWDSNRNVSSISLVDFINQLAVKMNEEELQVACPIFAKWFDDDFSRVQLECLN